MSAILSADDLNDFISPGVACIKPIETLPAKPEGDASDPYEVTTEDRVAAEQAPPAQISLTDCLACSGCVTSAEAVLVSLQSHTEVLNTLDAHPSLDPAQLAHAAATATNGTANGADGASHGKIFVASVSPQARASVAATFAVSEREAGHMIEHLLSGPRGLKAGGVHGSSFAWVLDTNVVREAALVLAADEVSASLSNPSPKAPGNEGSASTAPRKPILTSACPGWICYAEKTHPYVLPHLSRMKSPQALTGTLIKSVLYRKYGIPPSKVWHVAVMPCFDKKLEASRAELTSAAWLPSSSHLSPEEVEASTRDVDCVITARELLTMAQSRNILFPTLPRAPLRRSYRVPFPDPHLDSFLFPRRSARPSNGTPAAGPSGGYLHHIMQTYAARHPGSSLHVHRGRNVDVVEYVLRDDDSGETLLKTARFYGFRNIQNLVRRLKPAKASRMPGARMGGARRPGGAATAAAAGSEYAYVEVMACPGGCTNGGGQIKVGELAEVRGDELRNGEKAGVQEQREWLKRVDEAYFSASSASASEGEGDEEELDNADVDMADMDADIHADVGAAPAVSADGMDVDGVDDGMDGLQDGMADMDVDVVDNISRRRIHAMLQHWSSVTGVDQQSLVKTSYRAVESDVGKEKKVSDVDRVAGLASSIGGGW